jgi:predicted permease
LNNRDFTILVVTPEGFQGSILGLTFDLYVPVVMAEAITGENGILSNRNTHWLAGQARLKRGTDQRLAEADLTAISADLAREFSPSDRYPRAEMIPMWREGGGEMLAPVIMLLMAVGGVVLLIVCANLANLVLARAAGRRRELAIRQALGMTRARLIGHLLVENAMLTLLGAAGAMLVLPAAGRLLMSFAPVSDFPVLVQVHVDAYVLLFTGGVAALATILFGLTPALGASRPDVVRALKDDSGGSASPRKALLRSSFVVAQVALSMVLLVSAGLLLKSLSRAVAIDPGFDPRNVLVAGVDLTASGYNEAQGKVALRDMLARISALPGVAAVSSVQRVPLGLGGSNSTSVEAEGYIPSKNEETFAFVQTIGPDYFHTMMTRLVAGREFTTADSESTGPVVVINEAFARRYFSRLDALGRHVKLNHQMRTVTGVVRDSKVQSLDEKPRPSIYVPVLQQFESESNFLVRTVGKPMAMARGGGRHPRGEPGAAGLWAAVVRAVHQRRIFRPAHGWVAAGLVRCAGAGISRRRAVWPARAYCDAALARSRHSYGVGCGAERCAAAHPRAGAGAGRHRSGDRTGCVGRRHALDARAIVWSFTNGSGDHSGRFNGADHGGAGCEFSSCLPGGQD